MTKGYRKLKVWNKGYRLTLKVYRLTRAFPTEEKYGLTSQMRRASTSIVANLAEGYGKGRLGDYIRFVSIAMGSCNELEVYLRLSNDLEYLEGENYEEIQSAHAEVGRMLTNLRKGLERKKAESAPKALVPSQ